MPCARSPPLLPALPSRSARFTIAYAQDDYPSRPIRLVVPVAAGGGTDMVGRVLAEHLSSKLGQPVTVENRPGAGSLIGIDSVAKSAADGYTLILALSDGFTIMPSMKKDVPYDPVKSFTLIGLAARTPFSYSVSNEVPAKNLRELVDHAKKNPGKLKWAVSGSYSTSDLATELLKVTQGLEYISVPYRGGALAIADVVSARVDGLTVSPLLAAPQASAGKLKILAQTGPTRVAMIPGRADGGGIRLRRSRGRCLVRPRGAGQAAARRDGEALERARVISMATRPSTSALRPPGSKPPRCPPAEFSAYITSELAKWRDVVVKAGIPIQ